MRLAEWALRYSKVCNCLGAALLMPFALIGDSQSSQYLCVIAPKRTAEVVALVEGHVANLSVEVGDRVSRGQQVASIGNSELIKAEIATATASVRAAEAQARRSAVTESQAQDRLRRTTALRNEGLVSEEQLEDARHALRAAQASKDGDEAAVDVQRALLKTKLLLASQSSVVAPFDADVAEVYATTGAELKKGEPVLRLIDQSTLRLRCAVPSADIGRIRPGVALTVTMPSLSLEFTTVVSSVSPEVDEVAQTFRVESRIQRSNALARLFSGNSAGLTATAKLR